MPSFPHERRIFGAILGSAMLCSAATGSALEPGSGGSGGDSVDRATQAADRATQDLAKVAADSARDQQRYTEERAKIQADAAKDPAKAQEEFAKLEADRQKVEARRAEEVAKVEADLVEEQAKVLEDSIEDMRHGDDRSSSAGMQDVGQAENPDRDARGFPVRRNEVAALDLDQRAIAKAVAQGFRLIERIPLEDLGRSIVRLAVPDGLSEADAIERIRALDPKAVVDFTHYYGMTPAGEEGEAMPAGGQLRRREGKLRVGMIDTGVVDHSFLQQSRIKSRAFGHGTAAASAHGTAVASILVSEGARDVVSANVFRGGASGAPFTSADTIAESLEWLVEQRVPVVNISLAGPRNAILDTIILRALGRGMTIVASAGNGGPAAPPAYPAALRHVVAVTAVDQSNRVYRYANQGAYIVVAAPGVREPGAAAGGGYRLFSGTSFAAPHVSAWLARCLGGRKMSGLAAATQCRKQLTTAARDAGAPGLDPVYGYGVIR